MLAEPPNARTLIDELLASQRELPVARFARQHELHEFPAQQKHYRDLIPLTKPGPGEQYSFEVDLDKCSGCKACVTACHSLNGLDEEETWRGVGQLYSDDWRAPFQATVTTACHHCADPACLTGCPVLAYDKDPATGIVRHLDDQCIGCQYCVMKCPYEVPQYSAKRGIVRKCDMCSSRLALGEAPACVQACPSQAIRITLVKPEELRAEFARHAQSTKAHPNMNPTSSPSPATQEWERVGEREITKEETAVLACAKSSSPPLPSPPLSWRGGSRAALNPFLPASPAPDYTIPTTRYKSSKPLPANLLAADHASVTPANPHLPLVFMLVLSQLAVGASAAAVLPTTAKPLAITALVVGMLGVGIGTLHLGQPLKAWRAFLGWRSSWFSREVIVFGAFLLLAAVAVFLKPLAPVAALVGLLGVGCSAMIYADTRRDFWRASQSLAKFFGTTCLLGAAAAFVVASLTGTIANMELTALAALVFATSAVKLPFEHRIFRHLVDEETPAPAPLSKTARLLAGELGFIWRTRILCGVAGGIVLPLLFVLIQAATGKPMAWPAVGAFALCLAGELLERYLFFTAVAPVKMPGGFAS